MSIPHNFEITEVEWTEEDIEWEEFLCWLTAFTKKANLSIDEVRAAIEDMVDKKERRIKTSRTQLNLFVPTK